MTQRYKLDGGSSTSRISRNPAQTSAWSSASATVIIAVAGWAGGRVPRSRRATITCREGSAEQGRPFPHAGQAVTGRSGAVAPASWTVVLDDDVDGRRAAAHPHADRGIPRVLQHVGERLLHDPVHRRTYRCRIRRRFAVDLQGDRETRRPDAVHEGGELGEAGLWVAQLVCIGLIAGTLGNLAGFATGSLGLLDLGNAGLLICLGYLAIRPPMPHDALTDRRDDNILSSTARAGTNGAAPPVS